MVRPWKEFVSARMRGRPVRRAILKAASLASLPELAKKTPDPSGASASRSSFSASSIWGAVAKKLETCPRVSACFVSADRIAGRSEEHTSELQSRGHLVCRLLLGKKETIERRDCATVG